MIGMRLIDSVAEPHAVIERLTAFIGEQPSSARREMWFFDFFRTLAECRTIARDEWVQSFFQLAINRGDSRRPPSTPRDISEACEDG